MRIFTRRIVGGKVELPPDAFPEGSEVTVLLSDSEETFEVTPEQVTELTESLEQARRGECIDGKELLKELRSSAAVREERK